MEVIGRNSNLAHPSNKWSELQKRIDESLPRQPLLYQDKPKSRTKRFLSPNDTTDITARYEAGETTQHIASHYSISKTRVADVLREQGITIRRQGLTTEQVTEAATLYAAGQSLAQVGARFGVSHTTVAAELRKQGIQLRSRPGWS
ncbi:helix-turn-helix domain-containing protein [Mycolicibacterium sp. 120266]|uniref:helix-turn-helix domain-containing protein n=1 Tax=Mycolicibacterium sp. 120266 TaxID=3090601 RepID=UPI00299DB01A|nr:helix-turn-helix domain-containing protein [Mycolicibacterium sp. 120266]MDX1870682.1 helix-turn-helix domain-containing protein [Mycolicibacterium sp. 120266]